MSDDQVSAETMGFLASLMAAGHAQTTGTMNSLIRSLTYGERRKEATLALIKATISDLLSGPYAPSALALMNALYPSERRVESWLVDHYGEDWRDPASPLQITCECCY